MAKTELSVIVPARNEEFLVNTVDDIVKNMRGNTEVIVVLDGTKDNPSLNDHPKVHTIYHSQSIGQRAACNEAAKYSRAKYIAKADAHCSFDEGFDVKLLQDMQPGWCMVPIMKNLHLFDYVCENGHRRYQGPSGPCEQCGKSTRKDIVWIAKNNPQSTSYCVDPTPHFQYSRERKNHPEYKKSLELTGLTETMSLQGSFFLMERERYFYLNINDEEFGSWGTEGWEVAAKVWTSGGRVICSHKTWHSHTFRTTTGPGWGFPYKLSGRQVERAKQRAKKLFFNSKWGPQQILPTSWLVEHFWPMPYWKEEDLIKLKEAEATFFPTFSATNFVDLQFIGCHGNESTTGTTPIQTFIPSEHPFLSSPDGKADSIILNNADRTLPVWSNIECIGSDGEQMPPGAVGFSGVNSTPPVSPEQILLKRGKSEMEGVSTPLIVTDGMVQLRNVATYSHGDSGDKPCIDQSMHQNSPVVVNGFSEKDTNSSPPVSILGGRPSPDPTLPQGVNRVDVNTGKGSLDFSCGKGGNNEIIEISHDSSSIDGLRLGEGQCLEHCPTPTIIPQSNSVSKGIVYYSDCRLDPVIMQAVQRQLLNSCNGNELISVTLKPINFGRNIVLPLQRSHLSMAKQQLAGLEKLDTDVAFMAEHDILYPREHFDFTPPRKDVFWYNLNWFKVRTSDGQALHFKAKQVSGLCAYRDILIDYFRNRVRMIESGEIGGRRHFEPGGRYRDAYQKLTSCGFDTWYSDVPYVDIRHEGTVTRNIFDPSGYRNRVEDWKLVPEIPHWGVTLGRFPAFLQEVTSAVSQG